MRESVLSLKEKINIKWLFYFKKLSVRINNLFLTFPFNIILTTSVYGYKAIVSSSVVYIFHKGITL